MIWSKKRQPFGNMRLLGSYLKLVRLAFEAGFQVLGLILIQFLIQGCAQFTFS